MSEPTIDEAKELAYRHRKKGVVIIAFGDGRFSTASFGMNRALCGAMKRFSEQVAEAIESGDITVDTE